MTETSADTIRRAATLLRERATVARPGPWRTGTHAHRTLYTRATPGQPKTGELSGLMDTPADAAHTAALHPGVAIAIADLLEAIATEMDDYGSVIEDAGAVKVAPAADGFHYDEAPPWTKALATARAYLGET